MARKSHGCDIRRVGRRARGRPGMHVHRVEATKNSESREESGLACGGGRFTGGVSQSRGTFLRRDCRCYSGRCYSGAWARVAPSSSTKSLAGYRTEKPISITPPGPPFTCRGRRAPETSITVDNINVHFFSDLTSTHYRLISIYNSLKRTLVKYLLNVLHQRDALQYPVARMLGSVEVGLHHHADAHGVPALLRDVHGHLDRAVQLHLGELDRDDL